MIMDDLIFMGMRGYVVAIHRDTGAIVWSNNELKGGYTTPLLDGDRLIVATNGYLYCLDPLTGKIQWHNPMKGYGFGVASMVSVRGRTDPLLAVHAKAQQDRRSSDSSTSSPAT